MIIAIDGPSGTGKSTIAKMLAAKLEFLYFDTGAMYRSFAYFLTKLHISFDDEVKVDKALEDFDFDIQKSQGEYIFLLGEEDVSQIIRQEKISKLASDIAKSANVRKKLLPIQRAFAHRADLVCEGRDIGTVVFPEAEVKIFLTASLEIRAQRRYCQLKEKFPEQTGILKLEKIYEEINARDHQDISRQAAPLKQANDALLIDTSQLAISEVVDAIITQYKKKKGHK